MYRMTLSYLNISHGHYSMLYVHNFINNYIFVFISEIHVNENAHIICTKIYLICLHFIYKYAKHN